MNEPTKPNEDQENLGPIVAIATRIENGEIKTYPLRGKPPYDELVTTDDQP